MNWPFALKVPPWGRITNVGVVVLVLVTALALWSQEKPPADVEGRPASPTPAPSPVARFDWPSLQWNWHARIDAVARRGWLPIFDVESTFKGADFATDEFSQTMDELGIAVIAFGPESRSHWRARLRALMETHPSRFMPVPVACIHEKHAPTDTPSSFLESMLPAVLEDGYPMLGEFFFRHYPSKVQQQQVGGYERLDVHMAIDGPAANRVFAFSQEHDIPFQIHYEVEDPLLTPLEKMLARYPRAQVIWCHFGRVRYRERGRRYTAGYVRSLLDRFPNLYFDTSCSSPRARWPLNNPDLVSRMWDDSRQHLLPEWVDVVTSHPDRFLAALDLGSDRITVPAFRIAAVDLRHFLDELPEDVRERVAYRNAWRLVFHREF